VPYNDLRGKKGLASRRLCVSLGKIMSETNPYSAPKADLVLKVAAPGKLRELDFKQLRKLYLRSCNVNAITFLTALGVILLALMSIGAAIESAMGLVFIGISVFYAVAVIGMYRRSEWGRVLGIIVCIIALFHIPIGTLIGVAGLVAFSSARELFGINRVTHKELKAEFALQKANRKKEKLS